MEKEILERSFKDTKAEERAMAEEHNGCTLLDDCTTIMASYVAASYAIQQPKITITNLWKVSTFQDVVFP